MYVRVISRFIAASLADGGFRERNSGLGVCMYVPTANTKYELASVGVPSSVSHSLSSRSSFVYSGVIQSLIC